MENKNKVVWVGIGGVVLGFVLASFCFGGFGMGGRNMMGDNYMNNNESSSHSMSDSMDKMMSGIDGKTGDAFDKAFIEEMTVHHQGAIAMAEVALKVSKRPEILKLANDIISAQNSEITQMASWKAQWFK
ncbi:MAG: DUF305 domain-containing protein [bacterium]|nr:DUF305 domain-containing protein [bacterium]